MAESRELDQAECERLLGTGKVGRLAVVTPSGPYIVVVNYVLSDGAIVFRTTPYSLVGSQGPRTPMAFEVDDIDVERRSGWSVVARGRGERISDPGETHRLRLQWDGSPWAGGTRNLYVRLVWKELTGRRVGEDISTESQQRPDEGTSAAR